MTSVLGVGAYATVFLAHDPVLHTEVAIKLLARQHADDPDVRARFVAEGRTMQSLTCDRLVAVHDMGEHDGKPYLVMTAYRSGTLRSRLDEALRPIDDAQILTLVDELAACLHDVHASGVIHRDLSPTNVLIDGDADATGQLIGSGERLVLGDFAPARSTSRVRLTTGASNFTAPEQGRPGFRIDKRADLFAATQIVDEALRLAERSTYERTRPAIEQGRSVDPDQRHESVDEWADDLRAAIVGRRPQRRRVGVLLAALLAVVGMLAAFTVVIGEI